MTKMCYSLAHHGHVSQVSDLRALGPLVLYCWQIEFDITIHGISNTAFLVK